MSNRRNLILDIIIFAAFLAVANPSLTGMTIHEWLALAFTATIVIHLLLHWKWLVNVTQKFFRKLLNISRLTYVVDALFFRDLSKIGVSIAKISGITLVVLPTQGVFIQLKKP